MFRKQPIYLFVLFIGVILFAEVAIMSLLEQLDLNSVTPWLSGLLDALTVSLLTIVCLTYICNPQKATRSNNYGLLLIAGLLVFAIELLLMQLLPLLPNSIASWQMILINLVLLAVLCFPFIYWKVFLIAQQEAVANNPEDISVTKILSNWNSVYIYLVFVCFLVIMFFVLTNQKQAKLIEEASKNEAVRHSLFENVFLDDLHDAILDSQILADKSDLKELATNQEQAQVEIEADYRSMLEIMQDYQQLRYIDSSGMERVRIDRHNNKSRIVPLTSLQNKKSRYYFQLGMKLNKGQVYISPLDLNIEQGEIERPFRPMIRIVSPVFSDAGKQQGIVVINLSAKQMLNKLYESEAQMAGDITLLNSEGYWLHGADEGQLWGFMFEDRKDYTLAQLKPDVWQKMQASTNGSIASKDGTYVYRTLSPMNQASQKTIFSMEPQLKPPYWFLVSYIDRSVIDDSLNKFCNLLLAILFLFAILGAFIINIQRLRNKAEVKLLKLAHFDNLTGLANRTFFITMLEHELLRNQRVGYNSALLYLDLDNFKPINDELGHAMGDVALKETANRLNQSIRGYDHVARLGGDEFVILMSDLSNPQDVEELAERIIQCFAVPFQLKNENRSMGVSIGITILNKNHTSAEQALKAADEAMYQAKKMGKNCYYKTSTVSEEPIEKE